MSKKSNFLLIMLLTLTLMFGSIPTFANVVGNIGTYIRGGSVQIRPDEGVYIVPSTGGSISIGVSNINMSNANITLNASNRKVDLFAGSTSSNTSLYMDSGGMNIDARSVPLRINANSSNVLVNVTNGAIQMSGGGVYLNASSMVNINGSNGVCIYAQNNGVRIGSSIDSSYYYLPGEPGTIGQVLMSGGANSVCSWWTPFQTRYYDSPRSESNFSLGDFRLVKFRSALTGYPHLTVAICGKVVSISGDCNIRASGNLVRDTQYSLCMIFGDYMIPYGNIVYGSFHFDGGIVGTLRARGYSSSNQTDLEFSVSDYDNGEGKKGNAYCVFNLTYIAE